MGYSIDVREAKGDNSNVKGMASIVIDNAFKVKNIAIIEGKKGLFVSMPRFKNMDKDGNEEYRDVCHPISGTFRKELYDDILKTYDEAMKNEDHHARFESKDIKEKPDLGVSVRPIDKEGSTLKGLATVFLNKNFIVENIPVREGRNGKPFVAMPSYKTVSTGEYKDIVHPVSAEFKKELDQAIFNQFEKEKDRGAAVEQPDNPFEPGTFDNRSISLIDTVEKRFLDEMSRINKTRKVMSLDSIKEDLATKKSVEMAALSELPKDKTQKTKEMEI